MNFKTRLEAIKWMCENPGKEVYFNHPEYTYAIPYVSLTKEGHWCTSHGVEVFDSHHSNHFRTTVGYIPDPEPESEPKFPWLTTCNFIHETDWVHTRQLIDYHDALIKFLDKRYQRNEKA